ALKRSARRESSRTEPPASKGSHRAKRVLRSSGCCGFDWSRQQRHPPIDRRIGVAAAEPVPSAPVADSEGGSTSPITCPRVRHEWSPVPFGDSRRIVPLLSCERLSPLPRSGRLVLNRLA